jgi:hypothetical protein
MMMKHQRFDYAAVALSFCWALGPLPDGESFDFTYPDWGDRIRFSSGLGFKDKACAWDLHRCELRTPLLHRAW